MPVSSAASRRRTTRTFARLVIVAAAAVVALQVSPSAQTSAPAEAVRVAAPQAPPAETQGTVKISIAEDGWYRITKQQLEVVGFTYPVSIESQSCEQCMFTPGQVSVTRLHLYKAGVDEVALEVYPDRIEFYGEALDTPSSGTETYWLTRKLPGTPAVPVIGPIPLPTGQPEDIKLYVKTDEATKTAKVRKNYYLQILNSEEQNWFGDGVHTGLTRTVDIDVGSVYTLAYSTLDVQLVPLAGLTHTAHFKLNAFDLGDVVWSGLGPKTHRFVIPPGRLGSGVNTVTITHPDADPADTTVVDKVTVSYQRNLVAKNDRLAFSLTRSAVVRVSGFSGADVRMVDITNPLRPRELTPATTARPCAPPECRSPEVQYDAWLVPPAGTTKVLAFRSATALLPAALTMDAPSALRYAGGAQLLVISYGQFRNAVQPLVDFRRSAAGGGWLVNVVDVEDLYDEFAGGAHGPQAIVDYLEYARTHYNPAPTHVLLVGDASYDPRGYTSPDTDLVPTQFVDTTSYEIPSDDSLAPAARAATGLMVPTMAVGRLPARTVAQVTAMVSKIVNYQTRAVKSPRDAFLVSDNRGVTTDYDFQSYSTELETTLENPAVSPAVSVSQVIRDPSDPTTSKAAVLNGLNSGPTIVNFYGHGNLNIWTGAQLFRNSDVAGLTNTNSPSLYLMMTCLNAYFVEPLAGGESLAESVIRADQGRGAVAVWASSGLSLPGEQRAAANKALDELVRHPTKTLGQAMLAAKGVVTDSTVIRAWNFFGDPTTTLR